MEATWPNCLLHWRSLDQRLGCLLAWIAPYLALFGIDVSQAFSHRYDNGRVIRQHDFVLSYDIE